MASSYSPNLAIQLPATNDQTGQWGNTTNTNLGTLIESAISGVVNQTFADADITLPMPLGADGGTGAANSPVAARNMVIVCVGTMTQSRHLFLPAVKKLYVINNQCAYGVQVGVTGIGVYYTVPNNKTAFLYCDGTYVNDAVNYNQTNSAITGSFTPVWGGFSVSPVKPTSMYYTVANNIVTINLSGPPSQFVYGSTSTGTSNAYTIGLSGVPSAILPTGVSINTYLGTVASFTGSTSYSPIVAATFNSSTPNTIVFQPIGGTFNNTGQKGVFGPLIYSLS